MPDVQVERVKPSKHRLRYLSVEEEAQLLSCVDPRREIDGLPSYEQRSPLRNKLMQDQHDFILALIETGARFGEIASLEWSSIDFDRNELRLWRPKVQNESVLKLSSRLGEMLRRRALTRDVSIKYVFHTKDGRPKAHSSSTMRKIFNRAGLPDCSYHTLRHTFASQLVQKGVSILEVREFLGHTDIKTTMRYAHLAERFIGRLGA